MALFDPFTVPPAGNNVFTTTLYPANYLLIWCMEGGADKFVASGTRPALAPYFNAKVLGGFRICGVKEPRNRASSRFL